MRHSFKSLLVEIQMDDTHAYGDDSVYKWKRSLKLSFYLSIVHYVSCNASC